MKVALVTEDWKNFTMKKQKNKKIYNQDRRRIQEKIKTFAQQFALEWIFTINHG